MACPRYISKLVLALAPFFMLADSGGQCTSMAVVGCTESHAEIPSGPVDGTNRNFLLSHLPVDEKRVRAFVNDAEQNYDSQFRVTHERITFLGPSAPEKDTKLWVTYQSRIISPRTADTQTGSGFSSQSKDNARSALIEAVVKEQAGQALTAAPIVGPLDRGISIRKPKTLASLSELARDIDEQRGRSRATRTKGSDDAEGMGDLELSSPYAVLLGEEPTDGRSLLAGTQHAREVGRDQKPPSIKMLQRSLNAVYKEDLDADQKRNH